jgi:hypothetical protein
MLSQKHREIHEEYSHIFGSANKKKHEKLLQDLRVSITVVRTGTVAGDTGPTIFLLKGTKKRVFFTDDFLQRHGMAIGLTIVMTENAYMTDEAWLEVSQSIVKGCRSMPYVADNPKWLMLGLLDCFKSHKNVLSANELHSDHNIWSLKEESNSSHLNQGYNQLTAKSDKKNAVESLYDQHRVQKWRCNRVNIDQYDLVFTAMRIVCQCQSATWISLFQRVNLDPITRMSFQDLCKKISPYLRAGEVYAEENVDPTPLQLFNLLPSFWHGMQPADRRVVTTIMGSHGWRFTPNCIKQIHLECSILYSQMNDLWVCLIITREHPETVEFDHVLLTRGGVEEGGSLMEIVEVQETQRLTKLTGDLDILQFNPKDSNGKAKLSGLDLFHHMCYFLNVCAAKRSAIGGETVWLSPSTGLNLELSHDNLECIQPTESEVCCGAIMRDALEKEQRVNFCKENSMTLQLLLDNQQLLITM